MHCVFFEIETTSLNVPKMKIKTYPNILKIIMQLHAGPAAEVLVV
jgi:hypothetical protein